MIEVFDYEAPFSGWASQDLPLKKPKMSSWEVIPFLGCMISLSWNQLIGFRFALATQNRAKLLFNCRRGIFCRQTLGQGGDSGGMETIPSSTRKYIVRKSFAFPPELNYPPMST